jgi:glutamine synthetase
MAVLLEAGLDGIKNDILPPAPVESNIYVMTEAELKAAGIQELPSTLHNAVKEMRQNPVVREALGEHIYQSFKAAKRLEWASYMQTVSQWELEQYLENY